MSLSVCCVVLCCVACLSVVNTTKKADGTRKYSEEEEKLLAQTVTAYLGGKDLSAEQKLCEGDVKAYLQRVLTAQEEEAAKKQSTKDDTAAAAAVPSSEEGEVEKAADVPATATADKGEEAEAEGTAGETEKVPSSGPSTVVAAAAVPATVEPATATADKEEQEEAERGSKGTTGGKHDEKGAGKEDDKEEEEQISIEKTGAEADSTPSSVMSLLHDEESGESTANSDPNAPAATATVSSLDYIPSLHGKAEPAVKQGKEKALANKSSDEKEKQKQARGTAFKEVKEQFKLLRTQWTYLQSVDNVSWLRHCTALKAVEQFTKRLKAAQKKIEDGLRVATADATHVATPAASATPAPLALPVAPTSMDVDD
jgi:hypothetical protein